MGVKINRGNRFERGISMEALQQLIKKFDWNIQCWDDRYGRGVWAVVAPNPNHTYGLREITDGPDIESEVLGDYLIEEGSWLPVVKGKNLTDILMNLNSKVEDLVENEVWRDSVYNAFQHILEKDYENYGLRIALDNNEPPLIRPAHLKK